MSRTHYSTLLYSFDTLSEEQKGACLVSEGPNVSIVNYVLDRGQQKNPDQFIFIIII